MNAKFILLLHWAAIFQFIAFACCRVNLVRVNRGSVLLVAMVFTVLACVFLVSPFRRGAMVMKIFCGIIALPTILVLLDFLEWARYVF